MPLQPYVFPSSPSLQVKIVQEYLKCISELDFDRLSSLVTDDFTLAMSPLNLGIPDKTIAEELAILKGLESVLDGKSLSVSRRRMTHPFDTDRRPNLLDSSPFTISMTDRGRLGSMYRISQDTLPRY